LEELKNADENYKKTIVEADKLYNSKDYSNAKKVIKKQVSSKLLTVPRQD